MSRAATVACAAIVALALTLTGCKPANRFEPAPPPEVTVQQPVRRPFTEYMEQTGQTAATNSVKLQARVQGFLEAISYSDGDIVKKGATLFTIEPEPYKAQLAQAQANLDSAQAKASFSRTDYERYATLARSDTVSQQQAQQSLSNLQAADAAVAQAKAEVDQAKITLGYTEVTAPFDGVVTAHLANVGALVGAGGATDLATIIQVDPIWVNFAISERDVLRLRALIKSRGMTSADLHEVKVEIALQGESGFAHEGHIDYVTPQVDAGTGTLALRAVFANKDRVLLPGYVVQVRVPIETTADALMVPETALGSDQAGRTLLVVNAADLVEERSVTVGGRDGALRVIAAGIGPEDRVVVGGLQRAQVGRKVVPKSAPPTPGTAPR